MSADIDLKRRLLAIIKQIGERIFISISMFIFYSIKKAHIH